MISEVKIEKLDFGDYACEYEDGTRSNVYWERKMISDLYGTMTSGHDRFMREIERAEKDGAKLELIIEGTLLEVAEGYEHSQYKGSSMMKKLGTLWEKYHLWTTFCKNRTEMAAYILWRFESEGYHKARGLA